MIYIYAFAFWLISTIGIAGYAAYEGYKYANDICEANKAKAAKIFTEDKLKKREEADSAKDNTEAEARSNEQIIQEKVDAILKTIQPSKVGDPICADVDFLRGLDAIR